MKIVFVPISMPFPVAAMAQKSVKIPDDISITQLSDKVYIYVSLAEIEGWDMVPSSGMIIVNNHQAALLGTPVNDAQTETLVSQVTDSLRTKVTMFIPSHWYGDCIDGLGYLQKRGVQSYADQMTIDLAKKKGLSVPEHGFTDSLTVSLDDMPLQCYYLGGGHAIDNIVVWLSIESILLDGCMPKGNQAASIDNTSGTDVTAWPRTLDRVKAGFPSARYVIPGHGDYDGTELIRHTKQIMNQCIEDTSKSQPELQASTRYSMNEEVRAFISSTEYNAGHRRDMKISIEQHNRSLFHLRRSTVKSSFISC